MKYESTKTYGHEIGLSACFRQWRANSHCNLLHGYALSFKFTFGATALDERNWVVDFGGLKPLKELLVNTFDHKLIIAQDDPDLAYFHEMAKKKTIADVIMLHSVGCEAFAEMAFWMAHDTIQKYNKANEKPRVYVLSCECAEHGANSAIFKGSVK